MSNGRDWREYTDPQLAPEIEAYISHGRRVHGLQFPLLSLLRDTNWKQEPTLEWYALHLITERNSRWNSCIIAWGLNISSSRLARIKDEVMAVCDHICGQTGPVAVGFSDVGDTETLSWKVRYLMEGCFDRFDRLYVESEAVFPSLRVPRFWRSRAATALVLKCWKDAQAKCFVPGCSSTAEAAACMRGGQSMLLEKTGLRESQSWQERWNFDCMSTVFAWSGIKTGTMRAIARGLGFNQADRDRLIGLRCSPISLLGRLVSDPKDLLDMMHDCEVILSDSRAMEFVWPLASSPQSEWVFRTHPHVSHWLKFAVYLSSIGVQWDLPVVSDEERDAREDRFSDTRDFQYCPSSGAVIKGSVRRKGSIHRVRLIAHSEYPKQESSVQDLVTKYSSVSQCFIAGFGAACMYAQPTTSGSSFAWGIEDWENESAWQAVQNDVEDNKSRGIQYVSANSHMTVLPDQAPRPLKRCLSDGRALCIPFEEYVHPTRRAQARLDFGLLRGVTWLEKCHELGFVKYDEGSFWNPELEDMWAERAIVKGDLSREIPAFDMLLERLECPDCRMFERLFCRIHVLSQAESPLANLLFFCLENVEQRRVSWSFLQLPFRWKDCWEYPYI